MREALTSPTPAPSSRLRGRNTSLLIRGAALGQAGCGSLAAPRSHQQG